MTGFVEIGVTTNFSFLRGASHPKEFARAAGLLGYQAIGIADRNTLAGVVRMYSAFEELREKGEPTCRQLVGARLVFVDGTPDILAYPTDRAAYGRLCRLLSDGKLRAPKGECLLTLDDLLRWQEGLLLVVMPPHPSRSKTTIGLQETVWNKDLAGQEGGPGLIPEEKFTPHICASPGQIAALLKHLKTVASHRVWLGVCMPHHGDDRRRLARWRSLAQHAGVPLIATNDALYHKPERRELQDVVTCIREGVTLNEAGHLLEANAERHLKSPGEMAELFRDMPEAIAETVRFAERITFTLDKLKYNYPNEPVPPGKTAQEHLEDITWAGADWRYHGVVPKTVRKTLHKELALIKHLDIAEYFLTVNDIVQYARQGITEELDEKGERKKPILCQGRGSAANSAVCYMLGITSIDPAQMDLLFERFVSQERKEPPDIDVDFEHERREEVIQYIYRRYGHHRAALAATVIHYRPRSAIRETCKVFGLTEDIAADLASGVWGSWGSNLSKEQVRQGKHDPFNVLIARAVKAANELIGFPRHLSQHVGGFVLTNDRLDEFVPASPATMKDRHFIEWDKDDIDALRMMKVDVLALGMLTCIRKAFDLIKIHGGEELDLNMSAKDPEVYAMLQKADAIGVFQVESRAQMSMLPRLKPKDLYDLVIEVAIVRPGPIQGGMVHPYLRRRAGEEPVEYPFPKNGNPDELKSVLQKTLGIPLFQEQAMKLAMVAAKFSSMEANGLRRAMATFRNLGTIGSFREIFVSRMVDRGYERDFAERCFEQIKGFGSYGFPESHAASFAQLVYVSAWIKRYHPAAFACALLNSQPMGFYAPAEIVRDARENRYTPVEVRHVDVNESQWDNILKLDNKGSLALRLGFRQIDGFSKAWAQQLVAARGNRYGGIDSLVRKARLPKRALLILAEADCFQSLNKDRREILWEVRRIADTSTLPLFAAQHVEEQPEENIAPLPAMPDSEHVLADYQMLRFSPRAHLMHFLRDLFRSEGVMSCQDVSGPKNPIAKEGQRVACAGIVLTRQMPGDAGVVFMTLSDESGVTNVIVWPKLVTEFRREIMSGRLLLVEGLVQRSKDEVVHLVAERITDRTEELDRLSEDDTQAPPFRSQAASKHMHRHPRNVRVVPKSRDFH